jgi:hypothetical protein
VAQDVDADGGIASRNPEELLEIFTHLAWAASTMIAAERDPPEAVIDALDRIAPVLRFLRHADGGLARYHGGEAGLPGQLERALTLYGQPPLVQAEERGQAMGYSRGSRAGAPPSSPTPRRRRRARTGCWRMPRRWPSS